MKLMLFSSNLILCLRSGLSWSVGLSIQDGGIPIRASEAQNRATLGLRQHGLSLCPGGQHTLTF